MGGSYHPDGKTGRWFVSVYWERKRYRIFRYMGESMTKPTAKKLLGKIQGEIDDGTFNPRTLRQSTSGTPKLSHNPVREYAPVQIAIDSDG